MSRKADQCRWHVGCAYRDDDPDRCPWCHSLWRVILSDGEHSCEKAQVWSRLGSVRMKFARQMREALEQGLALPNLPNPALFGKSTVFVDLTGLTYGRLTAVERAEDYVSANGHRRTRWKCHCSCGAEVVVYGKHLRNGNTRSCGCLERELSSRRSLQNLAGRVYGRLTVIRRVEDHVTPKGYRIVRWLCRCECGTQTIVGASNLRNETTRSCGCLQREQVALLASRVNTKEIPGYDAAHFRHARVLGKASAQPCVDCGGPGAQWSYIGNCPEELVQVGGQKNGNRYCLHPEHYESRCIVHHHAYDRQPR